MSATQDDGEHDSFYASALGGAERAAELAEAASVEGLADEIALLRIRLRETLEQHPEDFTLLQRGIRLLVQALVAQHRLSPKQAENFADAVAGVIEQMGEVLRTADE